MRAFTLERSVGVSDELWLVQHPPVFTLGQAGKEEHLLLPGEIPVVRTDRGGQVTYHGPGQTVIYLMLEHTTEHLPMFIVWVKDYLLMVVLGMN